MQPEAFRRAADHRARGQDHECRRRLLHDPLKPVPGGRRDAAQLRRRVHLEIEHHQRQVAVAQQEVRRPERHPRLLAKHPEQPPEPRLPARRVERPRTIDERHHPARGACRVEQRLQKKRARAAGPPRLRHRATQQRHIRFSPACLLLALLALLALLPFLNLSNLSNLSTLQRHREHPAGARGRLRKLFRQSRPQRRQRGSPLFGIRASKMFNALPHDGSTP